MAIVQCADPDVLRLENGEINIRAPGRVGVVDRVALRVAPGWHQATTRTRAANHHPRIKQHRGVGNFPLGKVVETPAQVNGTLPAAGEIPVARSHQRSGVRLGIVQVSALKTALHQIILFQRILQQRHFIAEVEDLFRRGNTGTGGQTVTVRVHPRLFPRRFHARSHVRRVTDAGFDGVFCSRRNHARQW